MQMFGPSGPKVCMEMVIGPRVWACVGVGLAAMGVTKPYKSIGFGAMGFTEPYEFIGFGLWVSPNPINL